MDQLLPRPGFVHQFGDRPTIDQVSEGGAVTVTGEHNAHGLRMQGAYLAEKLRAAHSWHAFIGDDHPHLMVGEQFKGLIHGGGLQHPVAFHAQLFAQNIYNRDLVIEHQQGARRALGLIDLQ